MGKKEIIAKINSKIAELDEKIKEYSMYVACDCVNHIQIVNLKIHMDDSMAIAFLDNLWKLRTFYAERDYLKALLRSLER